MSDILRWEIRKIRKPHRCFGCNKVYPKGEVMTSAAYADCGSVFGCYWCGTCETVMNRTFEPGDEVCQYGQVRDGDPELWESVRAELEAEASE